MQPFFQAFQDNFNLITNFPLWCTLIHCIFATIASFLSFFIIKPPGDMNDLVNTLNIIDNVSPAKKRPYKNMLLHSFSTGLIASAIIFMQSNGASNVATAILYGFLGPNFLKNNFMGGAGSELSQYGQNAIDELLDENLKSYKNKISE